MAKDIAYYEVEITIGFYPKDRYNNDVAGMSNITLKKRIADALDMVEVIKAVDAITGRESVK